MYVILLIDIMMIKPVLKNNIPTSVSNINSRIISPLLKGSYIYIIFII